MNEKSVQFVGSYYIGFCHIHKHEVLGAVNKFQFVLSMFILGCRNKKK